VAKFDESPLTSGLFVFWACAPALSRPHGAARFHLPIRMPSSDPDAVDFCSAARLNAKIVSNENDLKKFFLNLFRPAGDA
jgi:hypothetical protein